MNLISKHTTVQHNTKPRKLFQETKSLHVFRSFFKMMCNDYFQLGCATVGGLDFRIDYVCCFLLDYIYQKRKRKTIIPAENRNFLFNFSKMSFHKFLLSQRHKEFYTYS